MWGVPPEHASHIESSSFHISRKRGVVFGVSQVFVSSFEELMSIYGRVGFSKMMGERAFLIKKYPFKINKNLPLLSAAVVDFILQAIK